MSIPTKKYKVSNILLTDDYNFEFEAKFTT